MHLDGIIGGFVAALAISFGGSVGKAVFSVSKNFKFFFAKFPSEWLIIIPGTTAPTIFSMLAFASHDTLQEFVFVVFFCFFLWGVKRGGFIFLKHVHL